MALLELHDVVKSFGGLRAVNRLSFGVEEGEIVGLIGPNGAGKTTVFNLVSGFIRPDSGRILYRGQDLVGLKPHQICHRGITRTFQITKPFAELTVLQNAAVGALYWTSSYQEALRYAWTCLERTGMADRAHRTAADLTVSEQRRLELARALATRPRLLLLDEVMAGLTAAEIGEMLALLRQLTRDSITVLLIEHVMRAVMTLADRIIVLHQGSCIAQGPPHEVVGHPRVIEVYLGETHGAA